MIEDGANPEDLRGLPAAEQLEHMEAWFRQHFEDPAQNTPHESAEGGYIWIWGGPYDAEEELRGAFEGIVPDDLIEQLANDLEGECVQWAPVEHADLDEGLYEAVSSNATARNTLNGALDTIRELLAVEVPAPHSEAYLRLLFANAITALETYLSDTFINRVLQDRGLLQAYIDFDSATRKRSIPYNDVLREAARVEEESKRQLLEFVWHNLAKVRAMYAEVLQVNFGEVGDIGRAIQVRHDIVHRNGRTKDGQPVTVTRQAVEDLMQEIDQLAYRIELKLDFQIDEFPITVLRSSLQAPLGKDAEPRA